MSTRLDENYITEIMGVPLKDGEGCLRSANCLQDVRYGLTPAATSVNGSVRRFPARPEDAPHRAATRGRPSAAGP